jgi:hypothetical protein
MEIIGNEWDFIHMVFFDNRLGAHREDGAFLADHTECVCGKNKECMSILGLNHGGVTSLAIMLQ